jgi:hypothetical protein
MSAPKPDALPNGLQEKFNALFDAVDSADYVPTRQSAEVFTELSERLDEQMMRLKTRSPRKEISSTAPLPRPASRRRHLVRLIPFTVAMS